MANFTQEKLTRQEWEGIEVPLPSNELEILSLIKKGWHNPDIIINKIPSFLTKSKIVPSPEIHNHIFHYYFKDQCGGYKVNMMKRIPKKADIIRLQSVLMEEVFEMVLLKLVSRYTKAPDYNHYTLVHLLKLHVAEVNPYVLDYVKEFLGNQTIDMEKILKNAGTILENNIMLETYKDIQLYPHQRNMFKVFGQEGQTERKNKLVLLSAPTGSGKTLSPIGLSEHYRVIFLCAARHVSLALARAALSANKKIALAFNAKTPDMIKLHYAAAKEFIADRRSGGIRKVDNAQGEKVEIMITDLYSYESAMNYMMTFNSSENIILYWDEPTILMDRPGHELHQTIRDIWRKNLLGNIVLSSATLPTSIHPVLNDYQQRFSGVIIKLNPIILDKNVKLLDKENRVISIPYLYPDYDTMQESVANISTRLSILKYIDINEIGKTLLYLGFGNKRTDNNIFQIDINNLTSYRLKLLYLDKFKMMTKSDYKRLVHWTSTSNKPVYQSTIYISTRDAWTLTHGPTLYMTNNVEKIGKFCLQQVKLDTSICANLVVNLERNQDIIQQIEQLQRDCQDKRPDDKEAKKEYYRKIGELQKQVLKIKLPDVYVPNKKGHMERWGNVDRAEGTSYTSNLDDIDIANILNIDDVEVMYKILLLMGIGVFKYHFSVAYREMLMKLAQFQKLYLIIASTDYIYGTNYQFCHGYIGKDLADISQEKTIQALGRIGRNNCQQEYTMRFRDNTLIEKLFLPDIEEVEAKTMCRLFCE